MLQEEKFPFVPAHVESFLKYPDSPEGGQVNAEDSDVTVLVSKYVFFNLLH